MKRNLTLIAIFLLISGQALASVTFLTADSKCPAFSCDEAKDANCVNATGTMAAGRKVKLNPCVDASPICSYDATQFIVDGDYKASCVADKLASLPGEACNVKEDCSVVQRYDNDKKAFADFQECDTAKKVCKGAVLDEKCKDNDTTCTAGLFCDQTPPEADRKCKAQLAEGATCTRTYECLNSFLCLSGKCTKPFTLAIGADTTNVSLADRDYACQSGFNNNNKCATIKYKDTTARENGVLKCAFGSKCTYTVAYDTKTPSEDIQKDCVCGYNSAQQGYCPYSRHDDDTINHFNNLITLKTKNLANTNHTANRFKGKEQSTQGGPACYSGYYDSPAFYRSSACAKKIFQGNCKYIDPQKCPTFSFSATTGANCVSAQDLLIYNRTVSVNPCNADVPVCSFDTKMMVSDDNYVQTCSAKVPAPFALPGEACTKDTDCIEVKKWNKDKSTFDPLQKCTANKCEGTDATVRCDKTQSCLAGLYCNSTDPDLTKWTCTAQLAVDAVCQTTYDCQNNLICGGATAKKCMKALTQPLGFDLTTVDQVGASYACASGFYYNNKCASLDYKTGSTVDEKGIVTCKYGDLCNYTATLDSQATPTTIDYTQSCQCGYNKNGQGYCPYAFNNAKLQTHFNNLNNITLKNLVNSNHSINRGSGKTTDAKADPSCYPFYKNVAFYGADAGFIDVLGKFGNCGDIDKQDSSSSSASSSSSSSTSFIQMSILSLFMMLFAFA